MGTTVLTPEEEAAIALLVYECVQLKDRNATDEEMAEWRKKVLEKFPQKRYLVLGEVAERLSKNFNTR